MRDTLVMLRRLQAAMACLPLGATALVACDGGSPTPELASGDKAKKDKKGKKDKKNEKGEKRKPKDGEDEREEAGEEADTDGVADPTAGKGPNPGPPGWDPNMPKPGEFLYFGPGRDPWTEHDEEEGCPKGDWCGAPEDGRLFMVQNVPDQMECASRIVANADAKVDPKDEKWKGFSFHPMMQGKLDVSATEKQRKEKGHAADCCYHWFEYCSGRPLFGNDDESLVLADVRRGNGWHADAPDAPELSPELSRALADAWLEDARMEHASIAAFARTTLELMALGAPPALLAACQRAGMDEVRHARACFALAARYGGVDLEPGLLCTDKVAPRSPDFVRLARDTFVEGCMGETVAALVATRGLRYCRDAVVRETLETIARDETEHAALAWRTLEWVLSAAGSQRRAVVEALLELAAELRPEIETAPANDASEDSVPELAAHGRLDEAGTRIARHDAWGEIVIPTLQALVGSRSIRSTAQA